uniref:LPS O-antigen chain length determinant protein WzzB n=1 Tax=Pantoea sp. IMH TaxID=1267600 RepID=UPI00046A0F0D|nr:LPS O-antigen chain length determinant protein WzzB [Pantoea sp. IMH]
MSDNNKPDVTEQSLLRQTFYNKNDELDLIDVVIQLWRGKITIIATVICMMLFGIIYVYTAKEKWTSEAIITQPSAGQVANYNAALNVLYAQFPQDKMPISDLQHQLFVRFSASISALSRSLQNLENPEDLKAEPVVKGQAYPLSITFSAHTAKEAQQRLTKYIQTVNDEVVDDFGGDIKLNLAVKERELVESLNSQSQIAKEKKDQRIEVLKQALKIAEASNVQALQLSQAEYLSDDTLYLLGTSSLQAMIANENTKPLTFDNVYYETQRALLALKNLKIQADNLQSYRFIMKPDLPLRRNSPKRTLIMLLSVMLGGIIGSAIVLGRNMARRYRGTH